MSLKKRQYEEAIDYSEKAVALGPNYAYSVAQMGRTLVFAGRPEDGLPLIQRAIRLSPFTPAHILRFEGGAYHAMERYEEAIAAFERSRARNPKVPLPLAWLAITYADMGRMDEARAAAQEVLELDPSFSANGWVNFALGSHKDRATPERALATLRQLGLPE